VTIGSLPTGIASSIGMFDGYFIIFVMDQPGDHTHTALRGWGMIRTLVDEKISITVADMFLFLQDQFTLAVWSLYGRTINKDARAVTN